MEKTCAAGRTRTRSVGQPDRARPVDAVPDHVPRLLTVSTQHVPHSPTRPAPADTRPPRPQPALRARSRVGRRGAKGPNPPGREGGLKNSIEERGVRSRVLDAASIRASVFARDYRNMKRLRRLPFLAGRDSAALEHLARYSASSTVLGRDSRAVTMTRGAPLACPRQP